MQEAQDRIKELMKPRYKVIADYPFNKHFKVDSIVTLDCIDERGHLAKSERYALMECIEEPVTALNISFYESEFEKYPHLFKKLEWWQERLLSDMPHYLKKTDSFKGEVYPCHNVGDVFLVEKWSKDSMDIWFTWEGDIIGLSPTNNYKPATEQDYNDFINQQNR